MTYDTIKATTMASDAKQHYVLRRKAKGLPDLTQSELDAFGESVLAGILRAQERASARDTTVARAARKSTINEKALSLGVKFLHNREREIQDMDHSETKLGRNLYKSTAFIQEGNATLGGQTLAYKYRVDNITNDLYMVYSVAYCRSDESFDPLIGMEQALNKFAVGEVMETPISHDRLGYPKLSQMARAYKSLAAKG